MIGAFLLRPSKPPQLFMSFCACGAVKLLLVLTVDPVQAQNID